MKAWKVTGEGEPAEVLELRDVDPPEPGAGFVRLRVDAAALGLPDVLMCRGSYPLTPGLPFTPGQEIVGTVTAVGPEVDEELVGSRQIAIAAFYLGAGGLAEEALAAATTIYPAPVELDDTAAAGFHIPFQTAWNALVDRCRGEARRRPGGAGGGGGQRCSGRAGGEGAGCEGHRRGRWSRRGHVLCRPRRRRGDRPS